MFLNLVVSLHLVTWSDQRYVGCGVVIVCGMSSDTPYGYTRS